MKKALITGASRGIGAACARALSEDGFEVVIGYNSSENAAKALAEELGGVAVRADVSDEKQAVSLVEAAGEVDVIVCCAGIAMQKLFQDTTAEDWRRIFAVNTEGTANVCRAAVPSMIRRKSGVIITVSSMWGQVGASCEVAYSAAKAGIIGMTRALAKEVGPSGICVNCIAPGVIDTDMLASFSKEERAVLSDDTPLCRLGTPEDVAKAIFFLASSDADFITGQILSPNGGFVI